MTEIITSAQMRGIERAQIESGSVTGLGLMERAGAAVVAAVLAQWPDLGAGCPRALVLCGQGNNGGDGFVVARLLAQRGWAVQVWLLGDTARLPADARAMYDAWCAIGPVTPIAADATGPLDIAADVVIDAIYGTGLSRPVTSFAAVFQALAAAGGQSPAPRVVAVDLPSGLAADTGRDLRLDIAQPRADLTVTFHAAKLGHYLDQGSQLCGRLVVVPIGLENAPIAGAVRLTAPPQGWQKASGHKFSYGHAVIVAGGAGKGGAARLAARGALRVGAGLVTLVCPPEALAENAARLDAVMLRACDGTGLGDVLADNRITAACIGPGLGLGQRQARWLADVLAAQRAAVLDADALTLLAARPDLRASLHDRIVLTPHGGEFARLCPDLAARLQADFTYSKVAACRDAAAQLGAVVLFKGADTVIAAPDGRAEIHAAMGDSAAPWLATAGAGDVLAGLIAGLLARGFAPFDAASAGAWLHAAAARQFGPALIAEDLPDQLPAVFRALSAAPVLPRD